MCLVINVSSFIEKGWYQTKGKHSKTIINKNINSFNDTNNIYYKSDYLKIKSLRRIEILPTGAFRNLVFLKHLDLAHCSIADVDVNFLENSPKLEKLHLEDNNIKTIRKGVFNKLSVISLYLHRNRIFHIDSDAFDNMPNLMLIKLNSNKITQWDPNWFKNTPQLSDLYVRRNKIKVLPENSFRNFHGEHKKLFANGTNSKIVDLKLFFSKNNISFIHPMAFNQLTKINQLFLDRNNLTEFDERLFTNLIELNVLIVHKNNFPTINSNLFGNFLKPIEILDFTNNKIKCVDLDLLKNVELINIGNNKVNCTCIQEAEEYIKTNGLMSQIKSDCDLI